MPRFISYVVFARDEVMFEDHLLALGPGTNAFAVTVEDPDEFRQRLLEAGCVIQQENPLDEHEAVAPVPEIAEARQLAALPAPDAVLQLPRGR